MEDARAAERLGRTLEAAWASGWAEEVAACFAPDGVRVHLTTPRGCWQGREAITREVARIMSVLPAAGLQVTRVAPAAGEALVEWGLSADAHGGTPSSMPLGVSLCRLQGGEIREERVYWDSICLRRGGLVG